MPSETVRGRLAFPADDTVRRLTKLIRSKDTGALFNEEFATADATIVG